MRYGFASFICGAAIIALLLGFPTQATAQVNIETLADITDRDYTVDLYQGAAFGSVRIVGMGGTAVAIARGSAGAGANPASPAIRDATSNQRLDWDWHVDWLKPDLGSDFDNNGIKTEKDDAFPLLTLGVSDQLDKWGFAMGGTRISNTTEGQDGQSVATNAELIRFAVARTFGDDFTVGGGVRLGSLDLKAGGERLFKLIGSGAEVGTVFHPRGSDLRVGITTSLPILGKKTDYSGCDPLNCSGYILPDHVGVPWRMSAGVAWRFAKSNWNESVDKPFRDERSLTIAGDIVVIGSVKDGHSIEAFAQRKLQRSGRRAVISFRTGAEYELVPGYLRVRGGSYWEPSRVSGVGGRVHGTGGFELRLFAFRIQGKVYRLRLSTTGDFARNYVNAGASVGFWH